MLLILQMVPFSTVHGFITSTSNLLRETNANTLRMMERLDAVELNQTRLMTSMNRILQLLETAQDVQQRPTTSRADTAASASITPGPRSLMTDFFMVTPGTYYVKNDVAVVY